MMRLKKFLYNYFFLITYYILKFISPIINIRLLEIETRAIGHLSEPIEIFLLEKKKGLIKKNFFDVYFGENYVSNEFLWAKWKEKLNLHFNDKIKRKFFGPIFRIAISKKDINMLIPYRHHYYSKDIHIHSLFQAFDINNVLKNENPTISFSKEEKTISLNMLKKFDVNENDKIILFCNRDPFYRTRLKSETGEIKYGHRDQNIDDYDLGIKFLCDLNYKVIRMGKNMHHKMNFKHDNFIDYAFSEIRTDMMDIFLHKICKFVISSQTGIECPAILFRKEVFYVNYSEFHLFHNHNYNIIHPKRLFYKRNEKELDIYDIYKERLSNYPSVDFDKFGIKFKNLDKSEIKLAFTEIIKVHENGLDTETIKLNEDVKKKLYEKTGFKYNFLFSKQYLKSLIN